MRRTPYYPKKRPCTACGGSGHVLGVRCITCNGSGYFRPPDSERIKVAIDFLKTSGVKKRGNDNPN